MPHVCARVIAAIVLLPAIPAFSQTFYGGVRGAVRDDTGVIVGAAMTLTDERTSVARSTDTNAAGEYTFAKALPGSYTLTATLPGFKSFERRGLLVGTQQVVVIDIVLEVGAVAEQITVTGETPALNRASASVASMIDRSALENIGAPPRANTYLLDGVPITDLLNRAAIIPSAEALEEVSVQVSTYDASSGRSGGGVFNSIHRTGTNRLRDSSLFRNRPDWGLSDTYFASQAGAPRPDSYNYLWAGTIAGQQPVADGNAVVGRDGRAGFDRGVARLDKQVRDNARIGGTNVWRSPERVWTRPGSVKGGRS